MIQDFFTHTRSERNGLLVLCILIVVFFSFSYVIRQIPSKDTTDFAAIQKSVEEFKASLVDIEPTEKNNRTQKQSAIDMDPSQFFQFNPNTASNDDFEKLGFTEKQSKIITNYVSKGGKFRIKVDFKKIYGITDEQYAALEPYIDLPEVLTKEDNKKKIESKPSPELFKFDPNKATLEELQKLGFSEKQASVVINYRSKGGNFFKKEDFQKMYCVTAEHFSILEPYIEIPDNKQLKSKNTKVEVSLNSIELNTADTVILKKIQGVGDFLASEIVRYRTKLGGFNNVDQLLDIKNMKPEYFQKIKSYVKVDKSQIQKININFCSLKDLLKHPYWDYSTAKQLINYRTTNGSFKNIQQLKDFKILTADQFSRLEAYLKQ